MAYTIWAHSPSLNQTLRHFNLHDLAGPQTMALAQREAESFAHIQNTRQAGKVTDWQPLVKEQEVGVVTLPNYLFHTGQ